MDWWQSAASTYVKGEFSGIKSVTEKVTEKITDLRSSL